MCVQWSEDGIVYLTLSLPPLFLETGSLTEPGTYFFSSWPARSQDPPVSPPPHPQCWSCRHRQPHPDFNMGSRDLNTSPHACATSKLAGHFRNPLLCFNKKGLKSKRERKKLKPRMPGMGGHTLQSQISVGRGTWISEFRGRLVYRTLAF